MAATIQQASGEPAIAAHSHGSHDSDGQCLYAMNSLTASEWEVGWAVWGVPSLWTSLLVPWILLGLDAVCSNSLY